MKTTRLGNVQINPTKNVIAGSYGTWTLTYTIGKSSIEDGGSIIIARRSLCDSERPQFDDPKGSGYTTVTTTGSVCLSVRYHEASNIYPWRKTLQIDVFDGKLTEGDKVTVTFGDRSGGGLGNRIQTYPESKHIMNVLVDRYGTGKYEKVKDLPHISIVGGPAVKIQVVCPSDLVAGQPGTITVRTLDYWGNLSTGFQGKIFFSSSDPDASLPEEVVFKENDSGVKKFNNVILNSIGTHYISVEMNEVMKAVSNPIKVRRKKPELSLYWGDIHGQTWRTTGIGTLDEYFSFGRDIACLDFASWQGNDYAVTNELWRDVCEKTKLYNEPGKFITFLGYEWSGPTNAGGDHNIYYLGDDAVIHRSSHMQIFDKPDTYTDRNPISQLWETFRGRKDVMAVPHWGGREANLDFFDEERIRLIEVHSNHGTFDFFIEDALRKGLKIGFLAGSDDHTGRLGLSSPSGNFGTRGGYVGVYAEELSRQALWEALWARRCYATNGERIVLWVEIDGHIMGEEFDAEKPPRIKVNVLGTDSLHEVELKRGIKTIYRHPFSKPKSEQDRLIKIEWSGVNARARRIRMRVDWEGSLNLDKGEIISYKEFAFDNPVLGDDPQGRDLKEGVKRVSKQELSWSSTTTGDPDGVVLKIKARSDANISFYSKPVDFSFNLKDIRDKPLVVQAGGLNRQVKISEISEDLPKSLEYTFLDEDVEQGMNPYWVRVVQSDGSIAWSSPIYVNYRARF
jgi:hypothetical protein